MSHRKRYQERNEVVKQILWIVVGAIIFMLIYSVWTNPSSITDFADKVKTSFGLSLNNFEKDDLIRQCVENFDKCKDIGESKYKMSISLQDTAKFKDISEAEIFFKTWSDTRQGMGIDWYISQQNFPLVIFATKINIKNDDQEETYPYVVFCNSKGRLVGKSKEGLGC